MHDDLQRRLSDEVDAELGTRPASDLSEVLRRGRGKRLRIRLMATASVVLLGVLGGSAVRSAVSTDAAPIPPAEERTQEIEPMRNGHFVQPNSGYWEGNTAPQPPGAYRSFIWDAFDQDTASFLYTS